MIAPLLTIAVLVLLASFGIYFTVVCPFLTHRRNLRYAIVGVILGAADAALILIELEGGIHLLAVGPLLLAGFLAGVPGAVAALIVGCGLQGLVSGAIPAPLFCVTMALTGVLIRLPFLRDRMVDLTRPSLLVLVGLGTLTAVGADLLFHDRATPWPLDIVCLLAGGSVVITTLTSWAAIQAARNTRNLRTFAERMELAAGVGKLGTWDWDLVNDKVSWDAGMFALYGIAQGDRADPDRFFDMVVPEDRHKVHRRDQLLAIGNAPEIQEFRIRNADGETRVIRSAIYNVRNAAGRLVRLVGMHMDVTDLRTAEAQEDRVKTRLDSVLASVPAAVLTWHRSPDGSDRIDYMNAQCADLFGLQQAQIARQPDAFWALMEDKDRRRLERAAMRAAQTGQPLMQRLQLRRPDGVTLWIEGRAAPRLAPDGALEASLICHDVTEAVQTQAELAEQRDRAARAERLESIGRLSGGIAHDFNNLLAITVGNLEILREELEGDADKLAYVQEALDASARGADLVRNMLTFARRARLEPTIVQVPELLNRVESWVARILPATITVMSERPADLWPIRTDVSGAENALVNLVLNARDAMSEGGTLTLAARNVTLQDTAAAPTLSPGDYVVISVHDTGHGIAPEDSQQIFEPFFTTRPQGTTSGNGLGLSTVQGFMDQSGGAVTLISDPTRGTELSLYFPAHCESDDRPAPQPVTEVRAGGRAGQPGRCRILLAEDEPQVATVLRRTLEIEGHEVCVASSGDDAATRFAHEGPFDLLVTDIVMPGRLQGPELAEQLRRKDPALPVILLSGYAPQDQIANRIRPGDQRLMKPVTRAQLRAALARALASRGGRGVSAAE